MQVGFVLGGHLSRLRRSADVQRTVVLAPVECGAERWASTSPRNIQRAALGRATRRHRVRLGLTSRTVETSNFVAYVQMQLHPRRIRPIGITLASPKVLAHESEASWTRVPIDRSRAPATTGGPTSDHQSEPFTSIDASPDSKRTADLRQLFVVMPAQMIRRRRSKTPRTAALRRGSQGRRAVP